MLCNRRPLWQVSRFVTTWLRYNKSSTGKNPGALPIGRPPVSQTSTTSGATCLRRFATTPSKGGEAALRAHHNKAVSAPLTLKQLRCG